MIVKIDTKELLRRNPYPETMFSDATKTEWKKFHDALRKEGLIGDKFMGVMGRIAWNNCVDLAEELEREKR